MADTEGKETYTLQEYMGSDAQKWAQSFMEVVSKRAAPEIDEGLMIGWFAAALETGKSSMHSRSIPFLASRINQTAHEKGWWRDPQREFDGVLMLIVSEAAEALEEWRNNHAADECYFTIPSHRPAITDYDSTDLRTKVFDLERQHSGNRPVYPKHLAEFTDDEVELLIEKGHLKPEGIPSELADIVIRVFDCAAEYGIDIEEQVVNKMAYNATRSHRHGGKRS